MRAILGRATARAAVIGGGQADVFGVVPGFVHGLKLGGKRTTQACREVRPAGPGILAL
jgi:hypothetical protein